MNRCRPASNPLSSSFRCRVAARRAALAFAGLLLVAGCQRAGETSPSGDAPATAGAPSTTPAVDAPRSDLQPAASPLRRVLDGFDGAAAPDWQQLGASVSGTLEPADGTQGYDTARFTRFVLVGFGDRPLPDGNVGASAGTRMGNEGEVGVTFAGGADAVQMITVRKFYMTPDVATLLREQLDANDSVAGADGACSPAALSQDAAQEYRLQLAGGDVPLLVTASLVDGGKAGPGYTDLVFTRGDASTAVAACAP